jgi:phosphomannomutase
MIPWLLVLEQICLTAKPLSALVGERMLAFPVSGEINRKIADSKAAISRVRARYEPGAKSIDFTDGLSIDFDNWRFNLRTSNTEPLVRLNVESRADPALLHAKTAELLALLEA